jgi:glycosyltransferase involved in cell wall biosynthesis
MSDIDLSVLVPTYNHEKYIEKCLTSITEQVTSFNVEIIVGDDKSTDKTVDIINRFNAKSKKIKIIEHKINKGGLENIRYLLNESQGKYFYILESDDYLIDELFFDRVLRRFENKDYSIVACNHKILDSGHISSSNIDPRKSETTLKFSDLSAGNFIQLSSVIFNKKYVNEVPDYIIGMPLGDLPLYLYALNQKNGLYINFESSIYRMHDEGIWSKKNKDIKLQKTIECVQSIIKNFKLKRLNQIFISSYLNRLLFQFDKKISLDFKKNYFLFINLILIIKKRFYFNE